MTEFDYNSYAKVLHREWCESPVGGTRVPWDELCHNAKRRWRKKAYEKWKNNEI